MADVNIDSAFLADAVAAAGDEQLVALSNGCICCSIREDLVREVRALAATGRFDVLVVESTGVSLPLPVAATFGAETGEDGELLSDVATLDCLVTVVDAERFVSDVLLAESLQDKGMAVDDADDRTVADLLVEQVEFANVLVLNKCDLVSEEQALQLEALLRRLNTKAKIVRSTKGVVPPGLLLQTGAFDMAVAQEAPGWLMEINAFEVEAAAAARHGDHDHRSHGHAHDHRHDSDGGGGADDGDRSGSHARAHAHDHGISHSRRETELERFGIGSFVYSARRPFHPGRLMDLALSRTWGGVLRTKGFFWLATRHDVMGIWQSAGGAWQGEPGGMWVAAQEGGSADAVAATATGSSGQGVAWDAAWGDRCQQLVWIGIGMDEGEIRSMLDACLLSDGEMAMGPEGWAGAFEDGLPPWDVNAAEESEGEEEGEEEA
ncbi:hypothetical protein FOA52_010665 [Chlamydomonas sp. UWO 241]|nr:hypothetical protein FOA52_010665 [Chlamydomonas sp. UWO 241]